MNRETAELEAEAERLAKMAAPTRWDRASWIHGAIYALRWVVCRRGAELAPLEAAEAFVPESKPEGP